MVRRQAFAGTPCALTTCSGAEPHASARIREDDQRLRPAFMVAGSDRAPRFRESARRFAAAFASPHPPRPATAGGQTKPILRIVERQSTRFRGPAPACTPFEATFQKFFLMSNPEFRTLHLSPARKAEVLSRGLRMHLQAVFAHA
jgi:hypothetical protein